MKKVIIALVVLCIIFAVFVVLNPKETIEQKLTRTFTEEEQKIMAENVFTVESLRVNDGKDGRKAYIAINGVVFDVSEKWKKGSHHGLEAGNDLTEKFVKSGHGSRLYKDLTVVGSYR